MKHNDVFALNMISYSPFSFLLFVCAYYQLLSLDRGKKEHLTNLTFSCLSVKFLGH